MRFRPIVMTGLAFVFGVAPMTIAAGASAKSQQSLGTVVMGGMTAVVILALLMVPIFFVTVQAFFNREARRELHPPPRAVPTCAQARRRRALGTDSKEIRATCSALSLKIAPACRAP